MMEVCDLRNVFFLEEPELVPKINLNYPLKRMIKMCLNEIAECRPTATDLLYDNIFLYVN